MKIRRWVAGAAALMMTAAALAVSSVGANASDADAGRGDGLLDIALVEAKPPVGVEVVKELPKAIGSDAPTLAANVNEAITRVVSSVDANAVNTVTWDPASNTVLFYVYGVTSAVTQRISESIPAEQKWQIIEAKRSREFVERLIENISRNPEILGADVSFVSGTPSADGSSITIGVDEAVKRIDAGSLVDIIDGVDIHYVSATRGTPFTRVRATAPVIAGGRSQGPSFNCTAGFPVTRYSDGQPNMLTADHCESAQAVAWGWGYNNNQIKVGTSTFQAPGTTDLELYTDNNALSPFQLVGAYNDPNSAVPIRGYYAPVGGNNICYDGAASGVVCGNTVAAADSWECLGFLKCYWVRKTTQVSGVPSAGQGDSGGPVGIFVVRASDNTIGSFGIGVVSMGFDSSTNCTGDAGGRLCSSVNAFAPLVRWTNAQSTHRLAGTTL